jgi:hypothetical protein
MAKSALLSSGLWPDTRSSGATRPLTLWLFPCGNNLGGSAAAGCKYEPHDAVRSWPGLERLLSANADYPVAPNWRQSDRHVPVDSPYQRSNIGVDAPKTASRVGGLTSRLSCAWASSQTSAAEGVC